MKANIYIFIIIIVIDLISCNQIKEKLTLNTVKSIDIVIEPNVFIFNNLRQGDSILAKFTIRNNNPNLPIKLKGVAIGCDCVKIASLNNSIPPLGSDTLLITYIAKEDVQGEITRTIVLDYDTPKRLYDIYIKGNVVK